MTTVSNGNALLQNAQTIAFIGLSDKPERHSYRVARYFQTKGFRIIPINPIITNILGEKSYPDLLSIPKNIHIDIVTIFRKPDEVVTHLQEVINRGDNKTVWLAEGISSLSVEDFAKNYGIDLITNFCIMDAHKKIAS